MHPTVTAAVVIVRDFFNNCHWGVRIYFVTTFESIAFGFERISGPEKPIDMFSAKLIETVAKNSRIIKNAKM